MLAVEDAREVAERLPEPEVLEREFALLRGAAGLEVQRHLDRVRAVLLRVPGDALDEHVVVVVVDAVELAVVRDVPLGPLRPLRLVLGDLEPMEVVRDFRGRRLVDVGVADRLVAGGLRH